jgi:hypothetical protein
MREKLSEKSDDDTMDTTGHSSDEVGGRSYMVWAQGITGKNRSLNRTWRWRE